MKTENLKNKSCLQKDSAERKEYAEVLSIFLPEDMEKECKLNAEHLMEETINPKNMEKAIRRVRQNNGAPGVDGKTVKETIEWINDHFTEVQAEMMGGYYHSTAVRRKGIPKPDGGVRKLGIPTAKDRIVQQAIAQTLVPLYEPQFSDNSFGYRPGRSGQQAIMKVKEYAEKGFEWAVVLDLSKYFDTLNHDRLIRELRKTIKDEAMMKIIKQFLKAGVMEDGVVIETTEGSPQGGNLSPILANIYLNEFDLEYARRGVPEIRYADDIILLCRSKRAAERILEGSIDFLEKKLKLKVNRDKSKIVNLAVNFGKFKYLGFGIGKGKNGIFRIYTHQKSKKKFISKLKEMTSRKRPGKFLDICSELKRVVIGWINYYGISSIRGWISKVDSWLRSRMRMIIWKRWKKPVTRYRKLIRMGINKKYAYMAAYTRKGYWRAVHLTTVQNALSNKKLDAWGFTNLINAYERIHNKPVQLQFVI